MLRHIVLLKIQLYYNINHLILKINTKKPRENIKEAHQLLLYFFLVIFELLITRIENETFIIIKIL